MRDFIDWVKTDVFDWLKMMAIFFAIVLFLCFLFAGPAISREQEIREEAYSEAEDEFRESYYGDGYEDGYRNGYEDGYAAAKAGK